MTCEESEDVIGCRKHIAQQWLAAAAIVDGSVPEFPPGTSMWTRLITPLIVGSRDNRRRTARTLLDRLTRRLETESVGALPGEWGVFSGAHPDPTPVDDDDEDLVADGPVRFSVECTLEQLVEQGEESARVLLAQLPRLRVSAAVDGADALQSVEAAVLELARATAPDSNRQLYEHLPLSSRPRVARLAELDRRNTMVALSVDWPRTFRPTRNDDSDPDGAVITLYDVVVNRDLRGRGLGSVVLAELCRFADDSGRTITGILQPGPGAPEAAVTPLARWYARHGFRMGDLATPEWRRHHHMTRLPTGVGPREGTHG